uniref:Enoyl reductase (ER) domain-containing protein n=1 Tax=Vitis vinifera TaxID=29760 RepID=F6HWN2_VITVI
MAAKLMRAVRYSGYGGGAAGLEHVEVPVPAPANDEVLLKLEAASLNPVDWKIQKGILRPLLPRKFPHIPVFSMISCHAEVPVPAPAKDEVLLKLEAASLNPVDWKIQKGMLRPLFPCKFPHIPVTDVAGEVVEVGSGVKDFKAGDKVVSVLSHFSGGGLAEFAVAKKNITVSRPAEVSAAEGAGLPIAGLTAHQALTQVVGINLDGSGPQKSILITAASGGVGHYAVQLAKLGNTHVTATCGARNIDLVKSLGADEVLDYKTPDGAALKSPSGRTFDAVIHCATGIPWSTFEPNLSTNGKVIDITPNASAMVTFALKKLTFSKKQLVPLLLSPKKENLECLVGLVKEGKLKTVIDSKHPLSKAEDAWAKSIDGHATGKIIVEP